MSTNPKNVLSIDSNTPIQEILILGVPEPNIEEYDLTNEKQYMKYLFAIERECRRSFEYKQLMRFLKDNCGMDKDSFLENMNIENGAKVEIHHSPLTLFDIVCTVVNKRNDLGESMSVPMVAKEVMYQHYKLNVGLIPLCKTVHELVHNQYIFIPAWAVLGNYREFLTQYDKWVPLEVKANLRDLETESCNFNMDEMCKVLEHHIVTIRVNDDEYSITDEESYKKINEILDRLNKNDKN